MASPVADSYSVASGTIYGGVPVPWAPAAGEMVQISHSAGYFGTNAGANISEISPSYQSWNPDAPDISIYGNGYSWSSWYGYCGAAFNRVSRQLVHYGTGHVSINVMAPLCFDLTDLRWKWLDTPLPFDALGLVRAAGIAYPTQVQVETYYPPEQYNFDWGDVSGDWSGWPVGFDRPGKIQPLPTHSYGAQCWVPPIAMGNTAGGYLISGSYEGVINASGNADACHLFDFDTQTWSRGNNAWPGGAAYARGVAADPVSGKVVSFGSISGLPTLNYRVFDPASKLWSQRTATSGTAAYCGTDHAGNLIHEAARLYIVPVRDSTTTFDFHVTNLDAIVGTGDFTVSVLTINETSGYPLNSAGNNYAIGWTYCPADRSLYAVNGVDGSNKYWRLSPPVDASTQSDYITGTWTLSEHTFTSGELVSSAATNTMYNRMHWDGVSRSFVFWTNGITDSVHAWRPAGV